MMISSFVYIILFASLVGRCSSTCEVRITGAHMNVNCLTLGKRGVGALARELPRVDPHVTSFAFDAQHGDLGDDGSGVICHILEKATLLISLTLNLDGNNITGVGARALGATLGKLHDLNSLTLSLGYNHITADGFGDLGSAISRITQLRSLTLDMRYNEARSSGVGSFARSLSELTMLNFLKLDFYSNSISNAGAHDLLESIAGLKDLASLSLDLRYNDINTHTGGELLKELKKLDRLNSKTILLPATLPATTEASQTVLEKLLLRQDKDLKKLMTAILSRQPWQHSDEEVQPDGGKLATWTRTPEHGRMHDNAMWHTGTTTATITIPASKIMIPKDSIGVFLHTSPSPMDKPQSGSSMVKSFAGSVLAVGFIAMALVMILWQNGYNIPELLRTSSAYVRDLIQDSNVSVRQFASNWPQEGNYRVNLNEDSGHPDIATDAPMVEQRSNEYLNPPHFSKQDDSDLATRVDRAAAKINASRPPATTPSIDELMNSNLTRMQSSDRME